MTKHCKTFGITIGAVAVLVGLIGLYFGTKAPTPVAPSTPVKAEVTKVTFAHQNGWGYLPFYVMKKQKLVEKHAKEFGVEGLTADYVNLGSPGPIRDALLAGDIQFGAGGSAPVIVLADKTNGEFKIVANIASLPMYLNTLEDVKNVCELKGKGKIIVPGIKTGIQAVTLQIAAKNQCGRYDYLDDQTYTLAHPEGMQTLLTQMDQPITAGSSTSHFTAPPFQYIELEKGKGKIKKLTDSFEILGGKTSFIVLYGSETFKRENPNVYKAVVAAFEEALQWIRDHKREAADIYIEAEHPKGETAENIFKQISDKDVTFDSTPDNIEKYANFLHEIGTVKKKYGWKDVSMDNLHDRKGS